MFGRDGVGKKKANHVKKVCGTELFLEDDCSRSIGFSLFSEFSMISSYTKKKLAKNMEKKNVNTDKFQSFVNYLFQREFKRIHKERFRPNV